LAALLVGVIAATFALGRLTESGPVAEGIPHFTWTQGEDRAYRVHLSSRLSVRAPGQEEPQDLTQVIEGVLAMQIHDTEADEIRVAFRLMDPSFVVSGTADAAMARLLSIPFEVEFSADGEPRQFRMTGELEPQHRDVLKEVIRTFQVLIPQDAGDRWHTIEEDANGQYEADYTSPGPGRIEKRKARYVAGTGGRRVELLSSLIRVSLAAGSSWLHTVDVRDETVVEVAKGFVIHANLHATLTPTSSPPAQSFMGAARSAMPEAAPTRLEQPEDSPPARPPSGAERRLLDSLVARLDAGEDSADVRRALEELLLQVPALADLVPEMIDESRLKDHTAATLLHVLELAGTPESQEALTCVLNDGRRSRVSRLRAIVALGGVVHPTKETMAQLWTCFADRSHELGVDLSNTAVLALGCMSRSLRDVDPERYEQSKSRLLEALRGGFDSRQVSMVLKALGNSGDPSLVDSISPYLDASVSSVRSAAAQSLGGMDRPDTRTLLTRHLARETNGWARAAIAESLVRLAAPPPATLELANEMVRSEKDTVARLALVKLLAANLRTYPAARATLSRLLETEEDETIRRHLRTGLVQ
jgi:hypothetical protein